MLYFDASALVKLVLPERETAALREYIALYPGVPRFSSMLLHTEVLRTSRKGGHEALVTARRLLASIFLLDVSRDVLERAAMLDTSSPLRTLDAIHMVTASIAEDRLTAVVTYDARMVEAAKAMGFPVASPTNSP